MRRHSAEPHQGACCWRAADYCTMKKSHSPQLIGVSIDAHSLQVREHIANGSPAEGVARGFRPGWQKMVAGLQRQAALPGRPSSFQLPSCSSLT